MKARSASQLLQKLTDLTKRNIAAAETLANLDDGTLHLRPRPDAWNALDCLAHLNHYGDFYLPEIRRQITQSKHRKNTTTFTSSWLGNYFATGMKPGPTTRKIKTLKNADPANFTQPVDRSVITEFLRQQEDILELLQLAEKVDLSKTKTGISITRLIRLRLGDTLRVVIYHNWRHIEQAQHACQVTPLASAV